MAMKQKHQRLKPNEFSRIVGKALRRAAHRARVIARMHGVPIYVMRKGKIVAVKP